MSKETDQIELHIRRTAASEFYNSMNRVAVTIGDNKFLAHIAETDAQKIAGLEVATEIEDNEGMLFPFESADHVTFHMGSVKFPLDIIFLLDDAEGLRINKIVHDAQPGDEKHYSDANVSAVLELKGGICKQKGIKRGDLCELRTRIVAAQTQIEIVRDNVVSTIRRSQTDADHGASELERESQYKGAQNRWDVYLDEEMLDSVFFDADMGEDEVKRSLVEHDGYDPGIEVAKEPKQRSVGRLENDR